MRQSGRWVVGSGLVALLFLCPAGKALAQEKQWGQPLVIAASVTPIDPVAAGYAVSWHDLEEASSEHLMTVTTPPGFTPEDVIRTVLENHKLPPYIRQPFIELARAKAPHLLTETMQVAARTELGAGR